MISSSLSSLRAVMKTDRCTAEESVKIFQFADDLYVGGAALREAQNPKCQPLLDIARGESQKGFEASFANAVKEYSVN